VVEEQRQKVAKEVHILEKEVEELKAANVRLIGHANSRQKIQLHRKLKVRGGPSSSDLCKESLAVGQRRRILCFDWSPCRVSCLVPTALLFAWTNRRS
jgi:hypothetical protein